MANVRRRRCSLSRTSLLSPSLPSHSTHTIPHFPIHFQRAAWPPYFDDLNAIIFLAPISCFDEKLAEDRRVNRLEDSLLLWKAVCANKLLRHTQLTLFLNKCDLLEKKLEAGVQFRNYVPSYGEGKRNDVETVTKCEFLVRFIRAMDFEFWIPFVD